MGATEESVRRSARVLTGFMNQNEAAQFAQGDTLDGPAFMAAWQAQQGNAATLAQGYVPPSIEDLPASAAQHVDAITKHQAFPLAYPPNTEFKLIELGKLIAMQLFLDIDASDGVHRNGATNQQPPSEAEILEKCLPQSIFSTAQTRWQQTAGVFTIYSMNNTFGVRGIIPDPANGQVRVVMGTNANLMLVREFAGRYVLCNGYHRAWMLRSCGVTHVPVLIAHVNDAHELSPSPGFFAPSLLMSARPPLVEDFLDPALSVAIDIRSTMRMVRINADVLTVPRLV